MVFLFSTLPANDKIKYKTVENCKRLAAEFQHYVVISRSLKKTFLSIKGIYYQAEIRGQDITWIVPYQFSQQVYWKKKKINKVKNNDYFNKN